MLCGNGGSAADSQHLAAELVVYLASGQADCLSGCFVGVSHDLEDMVACADQIQEDELYTLRLRT